MKDIMHFYKCNFNIDSPYEHQIMMWMKVQAMKFPLLLRAPTGSGKTEAVLAPFLAQFTEKIFSIAPLPKWKDSIGGKFTNALGRQYAYTRLMQIAAIFQDDTLINDIVQPVKTSPLTCGDSESLLFLESEPLIKNVTEKAKSGSIITEFPVPFDKETKIEEGNGKVYLMHERCKKQNGSLPLQSYMIPLREESKILEPSYLKVTVSGQTILEIEGIGYVIKRNFLAEEKKEKASKKSRRKKQK